MVLYLLHSVNSRRSCARTLLSPLLMAQGAYRSLIPEVQTEGNLLDEEEVLHWMIKQKTDESIEDIDRETLFEYIDTKEFLAVVFYLEEDPFTVKVLRHIELIDDEASEYGIKIVKCSDRLMAKKYGFRNPPGVTYFRKGKYINYDGDIDDDEELLDWLTDPQNMELTEHIEKVNRKMFNKIRQTSDYLAAFFLTTVSSVTACWLRLSILTTRPRVPASTLSRLMIRRWLRNLESLLCLPSFSSK
ncbi:hypothetical protein J6590_031197 [Homalodisca vitripennis]|nr:hypothetical protein J6590_031197 [Homalodisca vitripennis]